MHGRKQSHCHEQSGDFSYWINRRTNSCHTGLIGILQQLSDFFLTRDLHKQMRSKVGSLQYRT